MPYFDGGRGRLHYRRWPVAHPAATLALLPGTGQHSGHYHRFARALEPAGIELWTLDTAGHGLSEGDPTRPGTLPELSADAQVFLNLVPTPHFLMGHSLGAATALATLAANDDIDPTGSGAARPLAGLILCGTPEAVLEGRPPKSARGSETPEARGRGASAAAHARRGEGGVSSLGESGGISPGERAGTVRAAAAVVRAGRGPVLPEAIPVLIVHGVDDRRAPIDPVREWAGQVGAEFREYADAGHDLLHEPVHPVVSADIAEWIKTVVGD